MTQCSIVKFETPKKIGLTGLLFGTQKPSKVFIFVHGLGGSCFSRMEIAEKLQDKNTAALTFSNRGSASVSRISQRVSATKKKSIMAGSAHETFVDCIDDINGAIVFAGSLGAQEIYLVGHSTGCQKIAYWASKSKNSVVKGLIHLAPMSDYAGAIKEFGIKPLNKAVAYSRQAIKKGKGDELLPYSVCPQPYDAYRYLSLYTPDSIEQMMFPYFDTSLPAKAFQKITLPQLVLIGENEEYADKPVQEILAWFKKRAKGECTTECVPEADHSFRGAEDHVVVSILKFSK